MASCLNHRYKTFTKIIMIKCYKSDSRTELRAHRGEKEFIFEWKEEKNSGILLLSSKSILRINQHQKFRGIFLIILQYNIALHAIE